MFLNFIEFGFQTALLGMEAHSVIGLRMKKMFEGGPEAMVEGHCMVIEKVAALTEAGATLLGGGSARTVVRAYRTYVRANEARLLG
jgi:hypothetical protein